MSAYGVDPTEDVAGPLPSGGADPSRALMTPAQVSAAEIMPGPAGLDINPQAPIGAPIPTAVGPGVPALEAVPADPTTVGFDPLPAVPTRPLPTGNLQNDIAADLEYRQRLTNHQGLITQRQGELGKLAAATNLSGAQKQLRADQAAEAARVKENEDAKKLLADRSDAIERNVARKQQAEGDLTKGYWADKGTGDKVWAALMLALGGIGQATAARSAARLGQVSNAQNQGLVALNRLMEDDYKRKQANVAAAKDDVLEARYGFKDAADNHRAALNDIDADRAAKWRTVATETAAELARRGADQAQINADQTYLNARQKELDSTEAIHERQEVHADKQAAAAAQLAMSRASLGLHREQFAATRDARAEAREDKKTAAEEKAQLAIDARTVRHPLTGENMGLAPSPRVVITFATQLAANEAYKDKIQQLADHIERYGRIYDPLHTSQEAKDRDTLIAEVQAQGRQVSGLQASDAGQQLEHEMIGGSGINTERMASPKTLRELAVRADNQTQARLRAGLSPMPGQEKINLGEASHEGGGKGPAKGPTKGGGGPPPPPAALDKATMEKLFSVIADPKAPKLRKEQATAALTAAGLI